jgi:hypothetical protein
MNLRDWSARDRGSARALAAAGRIGAELRTGGAIVECNKETLIRVGADHMGPAADLPSVRRTRGTPLNAAGGRGLARCPSTTCCTIG